MPLNYWNESVQNLQAATIDVSINEDINIMRNNVNDERFIDEFVDFKKFVTVKFQNIKQKIANLNMTDQYPQGNTLNEQPEEWKEGLNSSKISRNSTKRYKPIASRNRFQPIYTEPVDLKEDDAHTNDLLINNLVTQHTRRPSPVVNEYTDRDLLHDQTIDFFICEIQHWTKMGYNKILLKNNPRFALKKESTVDFYGTREVGRW